MTSGNFTSVPLSSITVNREERQRRTLSRVDEIAESMARVGQIHPIIITRDNVLVAGETRYTAAQQLGWTSIAVQYTDELDPLQLQLIELEENTRRVDIDWKDQCLAIAKYHKLRSKIESEWTRALTADALGISRPTVTQYLAVAEELEKGTEQIKAAPKYSVARGLTERKKARARNEILSNISLSDTPAEPRPKPAIPLIHTNFFEWVKDYSDEPFNFLHCDFPYGIKIGGHGQAADASYGNYNDDPDVYWALIQTLGDNIDKLVAPSAHMLFWFSMKYYKETRERLTDMGWSVWSHPVIWGKSDNTGILPAANYAPRQIYETAFHCFRGKRPIVLPVANLYWGPSPKNRIHTSEKPIAMLSHFFRMYVDESTHMLDPTCGSGNAVKAALRAKAHRAIGLEQDENFYAAAVAAWES